ncbi:hypothetical protein [Leptothoe sp. PORK10 BA2]|uniref:hypothetical protein n=1 Tax=Leptothoe sp. PORK10 BA2 TaxID=3110254 RepID=UPI002B21F7B1|nr:hypothetical protein [Leptothoe sp. PORK10 BA2]MEA5465247.1 hypothetical protein [Leptothoe sp. PORK10 BA2]
METPFAIRYHNIKLRVERLYKSTELKTEKEKRSLRLEDVSFTLKGGECIHLYPSVVHGLLLDAVVGHTRIDAGAIWIDHQGQWLNLPQLSPRQMRQIQARTIGYMGSSEALRSMPTVIDCVQSRLLELDFSHSQATSHSRHVLDWVGLPRSLWHKAPADLPLVKLHQVNLARTFAVDYSVVVIDLPMDHFDPDNQKRLQQLIEYRKAQNSCFIGCFDQVELRQNVCDRNLSIPIPTPIPRDKSRDQPAPTGPSTGVTVGSTVVHSY